MAVTGPLSAGVVVGVVDVVGGMVEVVLVLEAVVGADAIRDEPSSESQPQATRTKSATTAARFQDIRVNVPLGHAMRPARAFSYAVAVPSVRKLIVLVVAAGFVVTGCRPFPPRFDRAEKAVVVRESTVGVLYRQGVARLGNGWLFSFNDGLFVTDDDFVQTKQLLPAIPPEWRARGFDHIGDIDVEGGVVYAALEQPDYSLGRQAMLTYDADTLAYTGGHDVAQHHNSFVTVDPARHIAYSMDEFGGRALLRYDVRHEWRPLAPLPMSTTVDRVQGADLSRGAAWLSTDDTIDGVYRVDLRTGAVQPLGSIGRVDGEGEGIDATPTRNGDLHVLSADVNVVPMRLIDLKVTRKR